MTVKTVKQEKITWYYFTEFSDNELRFLQENFKFHPLDLKDCGGEIQRSKIDIYKNYIFLVLQLPDFDNQSNQIVVKQMYIFIGKDYLITITKEKLKFLNNLFYKFVNNQRLRDRVFPQGSGYLLYRVLDYVLRQRWGFFYYLDEKLKTIEADIDEGRGKKVVFRIAKLRRLILQFKSIIDPHRLVMNTLSQNNIPILGQGIGVYFDDIDDYIEKVWFSLESYRDRVLSLQDINESLISYQTNKVMRILTVFSVALLPLTFLTGLYGMNINLPFANNQNVIWSFFGATAIIITVIFLLLKKKDWI
ncbi:MAG: hypothetical protein A3J62_00710 [Candidatus Buchananbacteria bacterium RIFCSPHIGHO2_02_FULL_38_8]|uniref:Magnesium transporter CorA n=2 Tax=Candidatus Buchananiibacteriota TaxID=1817903 RepID=A0A1G1XUI3_9BACT|nr:MAG: hypothetical protein A2731_04165 [Candidatus Buchananbacteria bacterium RIFCSPHIGHO2_01_FULL_39_8]OGY47500.1 MAG: hypothetical protein A3J62_00710 [Candidatus Buchananbacteria bacterium RIFCSPHIGHO2_02_FULL_38_8]